MNAQIIKCKNYKCVKCKRKYKWKKKKKKKGKRFFEIS